MAEKFFESKSVLNSEIKCTDKVSLDNISENTIVLPSLNSAAASYIEGPDESSLERVFITGAGLVNYFVGLYSWYQVREDLFQAGMEGLMKALKRFDPSLGTTFATYAGSLIHGEIRHLIRKERAYYYPRQLRKLQENVEQQFTDKLEAGQLPPSTEEIAENLNIKKEGLFEIMRSGLVQLEEVELSKVASAHYESFKLPVEDRLMLIQAFHKLNELQKKVINLLFFKGMTQTEAAVKLGLNQRKVSRVLHRGLESIRISMRESR